MRCTDTFARRERVREPFESFAISCGGIEVYRACARSVTTQR